MIKKLRDLFLSIYDQSGKCAICNKEPIFVVSYLHTIGRNFNNVYGDGTTSGDPFIYRSELRICLDCRKNKNKEIKQKCINMLKGEI